MPKAKMKPKIGLGIVTYRRPHYFRRTIAEWVKHTNPDYFVVYDDGSNKLQQQMVRAYADSAGVNELMLADDNHGVAVGKNQLIRRLMLASCDYIFISEDDVYPTADVFEPYIQAHRKTGIPHFMFAHHGPANEDGPVIPGKTVSYYKHCIGAMCFYTKDIISQVGLFDQKFKNAWEHVEHTHRILKATNGKFWEFPDITNSDKILTEIEGSIQNSAITHTPEWNQNMIDGLKYWREKDPDHFPLQPVLTELERDR